MKADGSIIIDTKLDQTGLEKGLSAMKSTVAAATAAIVGIIGTMSAAAIKVGADFEEGMSKVAAISGVTGEELEALTEKAKEMGAKTKFSATEASEAMQYMAMAGWKASDMVSGIDGIMNLAAASGEELASVSDIVTDALTAFGLQAKDSAHFADVLAKAASNSNTNVGMMGATFKYAAPLAGTLGYSVEDTAVAIGLMANAGIKGEQAGTALRGMLTRLIKPTDEVEGAMNALGISISNADGTIKPFNQLIKEMREAFAGLTDEEKAQRAASLAGQEAMSGFLAIVNASDADFLKLTDAINHADGASKQMAETMQDNLKGKLTILGSSLEGLGIQAYEKFEKPMKNAVAVAQKSVESLSREMAKGKLGKSIDKIADSLGDLISATAKLAAKALPPLINGFAFLIDHGKDLVMVLSAVGGGMAAMKGYNLAKDVIAPLAKSFQTAQLSIKLFEMANTGATVSQAALNGTLTLGESLVALLTGKINLSTAAHAAWNAVKAADPTMMVVAAVGALAAGLTVLVLSMGEADEETKRLQETLEETKESWNELKEQQKEQLSGDLSQIENIKRLREELRYLVDENGKVKEGYEARTEFILGELNQALGTEYNLTNGVIGNYNELSNSIDNLIEKKRVKAILDAQEPLYQEAINKQMEEANEIGKLKNEIQEKANRQQALENELIEKYGENWRGSVQAAFDARAREYTSLEDSVNSKKELLKGFEESYATHTNEIIGYEHNMMLAASENADDWLKIQTNIQAGAATTYEEKKKLLNDEVNASQVTYEDLITRQKNGDERITQGKIEAAKKRVEVKQKELDGLTAKVIVSTPKVNDAYEKLAIGNLEALKSQSNKYFGVSEADIDNLIAGLKSKDPEVQQKARSMAEEMLKNIRSKNDQYPKAGADALQGVINGVDSKWGVAMNAVANIAGGMLNTLKDKLKIHSPSKAFAELAQYIPEGIAQGVDKNSGIAEQSISDLSDQLLSKFNSVDISSMVKKMEASVRSVHLQMQSNVNASVEHELLKASDNAKDKQPLYAKIVAQINNKVELEGRETAHAIVPFVSEEFALLAGGAI